MPEVAPLLLPLKHAALDAALAALAALALTCTPACSVHYDQQVDGQTLDIEVMRPVPVNRTQDLDKSRAQNSPVKIPSTYF